MSKTIQHEMPGFGSKSHADEIRQQVRDTRWYYVYHSLRDEMLSMNVEGDYMWVPADTINLVPHLFNKKNNAVMVAAHYENATVKQYKWAVKGK